MCTIIGSIIKRKAYKIIRLCELKIAFSKLSPTCNVYINTEPLVITKYPVFAELNETYLFSASDSGSSNASYSYSHCNSSIGDSYRNEIKPCFYGNWNILNKP